MWWFSIMVHSDLLPIMVVPKLMVKSFRNTLLTPISSELLLWISYCRDPWIMTSSVSITWYSTKSLSKASFLSYRTILMTTNTISWSRKRTSICSMNFKFKNAKFVKMKDIPCSNVQDYTTYLWSSMLSVSTKRAWRKNIWKTSDPWFWNDKKSAILTVWNKESMLKTKWSKFVCKFAPTGLNQLFLIN